MERYNSYKDQTSSVIISHTILSQALVKGTLTRQECYTPTPFPLSVLPALPCGVLLLLLPVDFTLRIDFTDSDR